MIDWMVEVLQAYHMSEQSFFIAVNILDRFFKKARKSLPSSELHLTGMVAMFISSKYEDLSPLLMRTVVNKIGHGKFPLKMILQREVDILRTLEFQVGCPTILEFIETYKSELLNNNLALFKPTEIQDKLNKRLMMLSKLACCSYEMTQLPPSLLASAVLTLAVKLTTKTFPEIEYSTENLKDLMRALANYCPETKSSRILDQTKYLLKFVVSFDEEYS